MTCTTCSETLSQDDAFCGACGARPGKRRDSLTGILFDGRYRIEAKLAVGGFGAIYRATYVPTGARVALKVLHPEFASDATLGARFRREASALTRLRSPHTLRAFEHGKAADGTLFIAMELLTGRSLQAELREQGPLPWWRMLSIMRAVCSSLIEAHSLGIVHRDLKPANIHLERRGGRPDFVKVLDFGIAKVLTSDGVDDDEDDDESAITRVGQAIGTLEYMSPEQIVGGQIDHRTDIYTLGVVAYEMITGRRPFSDATGVTGLMTALMTREVVPPSSLFHRDSFPASVDRLIMRCLASDPQERYASASELADALDEILLAAAAPAGASLGMTLPGAGPLRAPAPVAPGRAIAALGALEEIDADHDATMVDAMPLLSLDWEPLVEPSRERLARTPHLDTAPPPPTFTPARGSTVCVSPAHVIAAPQPPPRGTLKLAAWAMVLLASGLGLGAIVVAALG